MKKLILFLALSVALSAKTQMIVFGAGCFWGVEKHFENLEGVKRATSGYAGGNYDDPTYKSVLKYRNTNDGKIVNHTEVVKVIYDDTKISTQALIKSFWELHDPTQGNRQGNDVGNNYRSAIFYTNRRQMELAHATKEVYQKLLHQGGYGDITTEIKALDKFYTAEVYHQNYLEKNPSGYCPNHATGVKFGKSKVKVNKLTPLTGKEILVIDAPNCRFCEKFKQDVVAHYQGSIPLRVTDMSTLKKFSIKSQVYGTPTILFIENGKEIHAHTGYMDEKTFYKTLGAFKLGKESEGYDVAFNQSTDRRFCRQYKEFANTGDGVFIDKISGDILFDTKERFNSSSGWLSFYKAVEGSTIQKEDNSHGMRRIEVVAKRSGAHLGHVFDDAPGGKQRFCINATVLEFIPRAELNKRLR